MAWMFLSPNEIVSQTELKYDETLPPSNIKTEKFPLFSKENEVSFFKL